MALGVSHVLSKIAGHSFGAHFTGRRNEYYSGPRRARSNRQFHPRIADTPSAQATKKGSQLIKIVANFPKKHVIAASHARIPDLISAVQRQL